MVNDYQICEELGRGAFGSVFKVKKGEDYYALKVCNIKGL
jgi:serine/threonine protein kinase